MKKLATALAAGSLLMMANSALAGKDSGLYVGGSLAKSTYDVVDAGGDFDDSDNSYKVFGGYNFGLVPFFDIAAEVAYVDLGAVTVSSQEYGSTALTASGLGAFNMGPFGVFAKYGLAQVSSDFGDENGGAYGIGARIQLGSLAVRTEWERFTLDDVDAEIDYASIGASWTF